MKPLHGRVFQIHEFVLDAPAKKDFNPRSVESKCMSIHILIALKLIHNNTLGEDRSDHSEL